MTIVLGLTGSIGMGKSTVARMFAEEGVPVFDADAAVHRLQGPDGALVAEIEAAFPGHDRAPRASTATALAERVLAEPGDAAAARGAGPSRRWRASARPSSPRIADAPVVVLDIPLLFEKGGAELVDKVAVVSADAEVQRAAHAGAARHDARRNSCASSPTSCPMRRSAPAPTSSSRPIVRSTKQGLRFAASSLASARRADS